MSKRYSQAFKDQVVNERLQNRTTIKNLSSKYAVGASTINKWLKASRHAGCPTDKLINVTDLVKSSVKITFSINGYEITCDDHTLPLILEGLGK
jgi:hypothetical protein